MKSEKNIDTFLKNLRSKLLKEMPKVRKEIKLYEERLAAGKLTKTPSKSPLFNE